MFLPFPTFPLRVPTVSYRVCSYAFTKKLPFHTFSYFFVLVRAVFKLFLLFPTGTDTGAGTGAGTGTGTGTGTSTFSYAFAEEILFWSTFSYMLCYNFLPVRLLLLFLHVFHELSIPFRTTSLRKVSCWVLFFIHLVLHVPSFSYFSLTGSYLFIQFSYLFVRVR